MIIQNGTLQFKRKTPGGIDPDTGYPKRPTEAALGKPIPCQYAPKKRDLLANSNGNPITSTSYDVLVELVEMPRQEEISEQVLLTNMDGEVIGEYSVIAFDILRAVQEVKITI